MGVSFGGVPFLSPKCMCSTAGTQHQWGARESRSGVPPVGFCGGLSAMQLSQRHGTGRYSRAAGQVSVLVGCAPLDACLQVWEVEGDGCGSRLSPGTELLSSLCFCQAAFPHSSAVLESLESLFNVVWDAFASLEHLGVSSSSGVTRDGVNLSSAKGRVRVWPIPVAPWHLFWAGNRLMLRCGVSLRFTRAAEGTDERSVCAGSPGRWCL